MQEKERKSRMSVVESLKEILGPCHMRIEKKISIFIERKVAEELMWTYIITSII